MAYAMATAMAMIARIPTTTYRVHGLPVQSSIPHRPLAARGESLASHRDGRGAPPARRDDRGYREYLSEEQRSRRGCIARRMQPDFHHGLLGLAVLFGICLSLPVGAQQGVGAIGGIVTDDSGGVLPGVTVTLSNPGIIGGNQETVSNDRGAYQFISNSSGGEPLRQQGRDGLPTT